MEPKLTAKTLGAFLASKELCVVRVTSSPGFRFNKVLKHQLEQAYPGKVATGIICIGPRDYRSSIIQEFLKWTAKLGLPNNRSILSGYYLFQNGKLLVTHPATVELSQIDPSIQQITFVGGGIIALLVGLFEGSALKGLQTFAEAIEIPTATNVFKFFKQVLDAQPYGHSSSQQHSYYSQQLQRDVFNENLIKAYQLLNVSPTATDSEVRKARNKAIKAVHPDVNGEYSENYKRLSAEINNAYDLITKSREKTKSNVA